MGEAGRGEGGLMGEMEVVKGNKKTQGDEGTIIGGVGALKEKNVVP